MFSLLKILVHWSTMNKKKCIAQIQNSLVLDLFSPAVIMKVLRDIYWRISNHLCLEVELNCRTD